MLNSNILNVGMASSGIMKGDGILVTIGVGASIAVALYDPDVKISGLVHAILPTSHNVKVNSNIYKFVDLSVLKMTKDMILQGAKQERIIAKIVGGAKIFDFEVNESLIQAGQRNIFATQNILKKLNIKIVGEDTGGSFGRAIFFNSKDGVIIIKSVHKEIYTI